MMMKLIMTIFILLFAITPALAQQGDRVIIRDTEIETTLKEWAEPLLKAAKLSPDSVNIVLVQSPQINAFVAGGANIFIYTGLIQATDNPGELIGVMAHEIGHIEGGHLIGQRQAIRRASYESILGTVLGIGAAILTGDGRAASAISLGTQGIAANNFFSHSRVNESSADQAGLKYMQAAGLNPAGLASFFEKLADQELLPASQQQEYVRTHPLTQNRITSIETSIKESPFYGKEFPTKWVEDHARMKAKLVGFVTPERVAWDYSDRDTSFAADYARAIAAYRQNKPDEAVAAVDALLLKEPENPYLHELRGQILVDYGRVKESLPSLQRAVDLLPNAGLLRVMLSHAILETSTGDADLKRVISGLELAQQSEPRSSRIYRLLATAYGRLGDELMAKINLAEEAVLQGKDPYAQNLVETVIKEAPAGSRAALQAQDILAYLEIKKNEGE
jgi:predicted Zn-dependent protease